MVGEKQILFNWRREKHIRFSFVGFDKQSKNSVNFPKQEASLKSRTKGLLKELQEMNSKEGNSFSVSSISKKKIEFTLNALDRGEEEELRLPISFLEKLFFFGLVTSFLSTFVIGFLSLMTYLLTY